MDWIQTILFGLVSGLTEILPVSADAHQAILTKLFGQTPAPLLQLIVHAAVLIALSQLCGEQIGQLLREQRIMSAPRSRRKRQPDMIKVLDMRLLRTASVFLALGFFAYPYTYAWRLDLHFIAPVMVLNGILLYIPMHMATGNKDSRSMSRMDAVLLGLSGILAVIPGISRVGVITSAGITRGADREQSLSWSLLLCIPALIILLGFDIYGIMLSGFGSLSLTVLLQYLVAAAAAYGAANAGIRILRFMAVGVGFSGFAYYCWGAALFSFILYLTV